MTFRLVARTEPEFGVPVCPLCHTRDQQLTPEALAAGGRWACTTCGQTWTAARLETAAAYASYAAAH